MGGEHFRWAAEPANPAFRISPIQTFLLDFGMGRDLYAGQWAGSGRKGKATMNGYRERALTLVPSPSDVHPNI